MMTEVATRDGCADECQRFFLAHRREDSLASALIGGGILSDHVQVEAAITDHQCRRTRPPAQMRLNRRASASDTDEQKRLPAALRGYGNRETMLRLVAKNGPCCKSANGFARRYRRDE